MKQEKRSIIDTEKGPIIVKTQIYHDSQIASEVTAVDVYRGKNVSVALTPPVLEAVQRHIRELKAARRSEKAKEAYKRRKCDA